MSLLAILALAVGPAMGAFAVSLGIGLKQCQLVSERAARGSFILTATRSPKDSNSRA